MIGMRHLACVILLSTPALARTPSDWFGTWKLRLKTPGEKPETLIYSDAGRGAMRMVSVEAESVIVTRFDGRPAADTGPHANGLPTLAIKTLSPMRYAWVFYRAGKPYVRGVNTLAADRRTFMERSWLIAKPRQIVTLVYDRQ